jgi:hypothetical protein
MIKVRGTGWSTHPWTEVGEACNATSPSDAQRGNHPVGETGEDAEFLLAELCCDTHGLAESTACELRVDDIWMPPKDRYDVRGHLDARCHERPVVDENGDGAGIGDLE